MSTEMNCEQIRELGLGPEGPSGAGLPPAVAEHLASCPNCAHLAASLQLASRLRDELPSLGSDDSESLGLAGQQIHRRIARRARNRRLTGTAVAAATVLMASALVLETAERRSASGPRPHAPSQSLTAQTQTEPSEEVSKELVNGQEAVPVLLTVYDAHGRPHQVQAYVVPGERRLISFEELSPIEQHAVKRFFELHEGETRLTSL